MRDGQLCRRRITGTDEESTDCGKAYSRLVGMFFGSTGEYMVRIGNETQEVTGNVNSFLLLSTSDYDMVAYNEPQGVTVNGNIATLNTVTTRSEGSSVVTGNPR